MKTLITTISIAAAALCLHADEYYLNPTNAEQFLTNARLIGAGATNALCIHATVYPRVALSSATLSQMDQLMQAAPDMVVFRFSTTVSTRFPATGKRIAESIKSSNPWYSTVLVKAADGTAPDVYEIVAGRLGSLLYNNSWLTGDRLADISRRLMAVAPRMARIKLRSEGKPITEKDGVDPVKALIDPIAAALNAPRFAGLRDACAAVGLDVPQPELTSIPTAESADGKKFLDGVFIGDIKMDGRTTGKLRYMLGTDGYNAFVERYNGGTR